MIELNKIYEGDALEILKTFEDNSIDCCITSPPYFGLRDYGTVGQLGLEETPELYIAKMVEVFKDVKRVLKKDATCWVNIGDSYAGGDKNGKASNEKSTLGGGKTTQLIASSVKLKSNHGLKPKDLIGIPWMLAFALRADGWYLRQDIIWSKPNPMPESVTDRCTKSHEYIFLLSKSAKYYYDADAIKTDAVEINWETRLERESIKSGPTEKINGIRTKSTVGNRNGELNGLHSGKEYFETGKANKRSVWTVTTMPYKESHFATFPERLITDMIKAGCPENGIVLDPFMGAGTTGLVARKLNRNFVGIELNPAYIRLAERRFKKELGMFI